MSTWGADAQNCAECNYAVVSGQAEGPDWLWQIDLREDGNCLSI